MKRAVASLAVVLAATTTIVSGTASAAAPPTLTAARAAKAIPYPVLPLIKAKADFPLRKQVGSTLSIPCATEPVFPRKTPAYVHQYTSYSRGSGKADTAVSVLAGVYVYKTAAASAAALKAYTHAEKPCPRYSILDIGRVRVRNHVVTNAATTLAHWPGWQTVVKSTIDGHPEYETSVDEFVRHGNALLEVSLLTDNGYATTPVAQKRVRQVTATLIAKLDAQFR